VPIGINLGDMILNIGFDLHVKSCHKHSASSFPNKIIKDQLGFSRTGSVSTIFNVGVPFSPGLQSRTFFNGLEEGYAAQQNQKRHPQVLTITQEVARFAHWISS
jgi:hypothetical protein